MASRPPTPLADSERGDRVKIRELEVPGSYAVDLTVHGDSRGRFGEWYRKDVLTDVSGRPFTVAQANHSVSARGVLRGVHFALVPPGQAKYVYCSAGAILDVVVDLRAGSPTFAVHDAVLLDSAQPRAVYLSEGLGHAFLALADGSSVTYLVSATYNPQREFGVHPLDPELDLPWLDDMQIELSRKDALAPSLAEARQKGLLPSWDACRPYYRRTT